MGFTANFGTHKLVNRGTGRSLKFDTVHYNVGNGYNSQTGLLSVPSLGTSVSCVNVGLQT